MDDEIKLKVIEIIRKTIPEIHFDQNKNDNLNLDSLQKVKLVVQLEYAFTISFPDDVLMLDKFNSLDDIVKAVSNSKG